MNAIRQAPDHPRPQNLEARGERIRVLVVDDHQAVRAGVAALLLDEPGIGIVEEAANYGEAVARAEAAWPDVAVVDFYLPGRDGLAVTRRLKAIVDPPGVLIYSAFADERLALAALIAGGDGILSKRYLGVDLCELVKALAAGHGSEISISPEALAAASYDLDLDDRPILGLLAKGIPPAEIATALGVSEHRLEERRSAMLEALADAPTPSAPSAHSEPGPRDPLGRLRDARSARH